MKNAKVLYSVRDVRTGEWIAKDAPLEEAARALGIKPSALESRYSKQRKTAVPQKYYVWKNKVVTE